MFHSYFIALETNSAWKPVAAMPGKALFEPSHFQALFHRCEEATMEKSKFEQEISRGRQSAGDQSRADRGQGYRDDNTEDYTQSEMDVLNSEFDRRFRAGEWGSDEDLASKWFADDVAKRLQIKEKGRKKK